MLIISQSTDFTSRSKDFGSKHHALICLLQVAYEAHHHILYTCYHIQIPPAYPMNGR